MAYRFLCKTRAALIEPLTRISSLPLCNNAESYSVLCQEASQIKTDSIPENTSENVGLKIFRDSNFCGIATHRSIPHSHTNCTLMQLALFDQRH